MANVTGFISGFNKTNNSQDKTGDDFISTPILDPIPQATNSSEFKISGQALKDQEVSIFVNSALSDSKETKEDGTFSFTIFLKPGENRIKVQASKDDQKSDFSDEETISYINKPPTIDLKSPSDGQKFEKDQNTADIKGTTEAGVTVTVNDFQAVVDGSGNFSYSLILQNGDNNIKIIATNLAGDKTEKNLKVTYSP